ncbi:uncharacterized protein DDB_G0290685-like [Armigeres subalbatus]|uniref:uncharacterized protein DDB_G0290685-like n=1 Tax=Armigeres subalbatus TaxID=124917 RepID=UPI002ED0A805
MFKIATVLITMASIAIHAAPQGRRNSGVGRNDLGGEGDAWRLEDISSGNQLGTANNGIRRAFWQYKIAHIRPNKGVWQSENRGERNREEQNSQEEGRQTEPNRSDEAEEIDERQIEEPAQENEQEGEREGNRQNSRRGRVRNESRLQGEDRAAVERNSEGGEQQRGRGRQEARQGRRQEESRESSQESDDQTEPADQIQEEQEGSDEVSQENQRENGQENNASKGIADYEYSYGVNDPATGDHKDQWEKRVGDHVEGGYILDQPDGKRRVVKYESGKKGFETNIMQIERKKGQKKSSKKQKSVAHSYANVKQNN